MKAFQSIVNRPLTDRHTGYIVNNFGHVGGGRGGGRAGAKKRSLYAEVVGGGGVGYLHDEKGVVGAVPRPCMGTAHEQTYRHD